MDASLFLLFQAVREHATMVISGESADEIFGGYPWFHTRRDGDYPWRYLAGRSGTYQALLRADVAAGLGIATHRANHYRQALSEVPVLPGETDAQRRMREVFHLHLTRWLPDLLPASVIHRTKAPYPVTQDPAYDRAIRDQATDLLATPTAPVWTFLDPRHLRNRLTRQTNDRATRAGIDFALSLDVWLRTTSA